jgi:hypothetical protein
MMLKELAERELLVLHGDAIGFHDLQHEFLLLGADDTRLAHDELLAAYRALLPPDDPHWHRLPPSEPYIWEHLLEHLRGASDAAGAYEVVTDLAYLAARCARDGPHAVEADLRTAARLHPGDAAIDWILGIFIRWGHLFTGPLSDVATTLAIRAQHPPAPLSIPALRAVTSGPLLIPRWGLPDAPDALRRTLEGHSDGVVRSRVFTRRRNARKPRQRLDGTVVGSRQRPTHPHPQVRLRLGGSPGGILT